MIEQQFSHKMEINCNYEKDQGIINFQAILREDKKMFGLGDIAVPDSLQDTLQNVEQGFRAQLGFNFPFKEFIEGGKSNYELFFKGFKYQSEILFLRKIKKVMIEAFKDFKENGS